MTFLDDCLCGRSQHLTFPRRELLQKAASYALLLFASRPKSVVKLPTKYPAPDFAIGDKVASYWPADTYDDDGNVPGPEIGEVTGICWHPTSHQWKYQINWTSGACEAWAYPNFEELLSDASDLERLA
ncbi:MAG: hypothetical protein ACM65M_21070 [Microcoleus sp.]